MFNEDKRFYGVYLGKCLDISDPTNRYRIKVSIPQVFGDDITTWAEACLPATALYNHDADGDPYNKTKPSTMEYSLTTESAGAPSHTHDLSIHSHVALPKLKDKVWVMFIAGDPNYPIWIGVNP